MGYCGYPDVVPLVKRPDARRFMFIPAGLRNQMVVAPQHASIVLSC